MKAADVAKHESRGDAELVKDVIPTSRVVPDLVFDGLALACPVDLSLIHI